MSNHCSSPFFPSYQITSPTSEFEILLDDNDSLSQSPITSPIQTNYFLNIQIPSLSGIKLSPTINLVESTSPVPSSNPSSSVKSSNKSIMKAQSSSVLPNARTQIYTKRSPVGNIGKRTKKEREREASPSFQSSTGLSERFLEVRVEDGGKVKLPPSTSGSSFSCSNGNSNSHHSTSNVLRSKTNLPSSSSKKLLSEKERELMILREREREIAEQEREKEKMGLYEWDYFEDVREYMRGFQVSLFPFISLYLPEH
jgi:hypothetical protein